MKTQGYTLIEIMVALAVFAILAVLTSVAMYHAFNTRARVNIHSDRLSELQLAMTIITRDAQQAVNRPVREAEMHLSSSFIGQPLYFEFTRGGIVNPNGTEKRSTMKRIAFICQEQQLIRRSWNLDEPKRKQYQDKIILNNLDSCSFAYLSHNRQVLTDWHEHVVMQNQIKDPMPIAIQWTLKLHNWGEMSLLFIIPEGLYAG
ncbi:GspJ family T2SS minor pseudopilin variant LspJ [Legionella oakridgensis]|uniref:Type II secretion system protein J n=2 Tax=Legionella oakridgensis TaxID=29423 RepID=W0BEP0_9GAMM|nr:GspJ family T2SS minor pseudopilin variant LspJ [Legionella oakridgensis]AHE67166.1 general secretion pathway protein J [Legionella oakridgensis ATCC 33761 = DSM 21215]ETO93135.1 general secretion pathway protein J [Legionella oakridgensis RV-2-2007]KTD38029.1 type II secretory pathway protein LspJ [Legionella oakridgensis]STY20249.1 general secretion pathway protein J [Legionella longbeachae]